MPPPGKSILTEMTAALWPDGQPTLPHREITKKSDLMIASGLISKAELTYITLDRMK
jgi:hypothetical protein